ncbi:MAG: helix-turn-helix domain-containing protein [Tumebacillaceae bacterium]
MSIEWSDIRDQITSNLTQEELDLIAFQVDMLGAIAIQRQKLELTQRQLAEKAGMNQSTLAHILTGSVVPRVGTILKITKALNLKLTITLTEEEQAATSETALPIMEQDTIQLWQTLEER